MSSHFSDSFKLLRDDTDIIWEWSQRFLCFVALGRSVGVIRIWGFTGEAPQSPEGLRSPSPTAGLSNLEGLAGRERGGCLTPRFCHLERGPEKPSV